MSNVISLNDIKFDLLKIIEPWDGILEAGNPKPVRSLFNAYLSDLQKEKMIYDFSIDTADRETAFTFDVNIRMSPTRSPKKLKIHVGVFQAPWVKKAA
jgi:hypothetical protein